MSGPDLIESILEGTPDPIFVKSIQGHLVLMNSAFANSLGRSKEWLMGKRTADYMGAELAPPIDAVDRRVMSTGITEVVEERLSKDGESRVFLCTKSAWRDAMGVILGMICVARDITDRNRTEQALRESQDRLSLALRAGQMGTWDFDLTTGRLDWSDGHYQLFGLKPGECTPTSELFTSRIEPSDRECVDKVVARAVANLEDFTVAYRVAWADRSIHWLEARGQVIVENGRAVRTVGVVIDITNRKRTEDRLRDAAKFESLGILAGGIAHDFNNLLLGMMGNASLICEELPHSSNIAKMARSIVQAGERAASLTRQMLAYSGRGQFAVEPVDLCHEVAEVAGRLNSSIPKTVGLKLDLSSGLARIEADRGLIQQLIMNLVLNAAEAIGPEGGTVQVTTRLRALVPEDYGHVASAEAPHTGNYICLEVRDNGQGMSPQVRERIFEPFFTTKFTGRGLGLAAVIGIVRSHRGLIRVESEPGAGTLVVVMLPPMAAIPVDATK